MSELKLQGQWQGSGKLITIDAQIFFFEEDGINIAYLPSLDLSGYGNDFEEAEASLKHTLNEFLKYTTNKNTLFVELKRLGWKIKSPKRKMEAPPISDMLANNDQLKDLVNNKQYKTSTFPISIPSFA
jgi:hypothetical protein